MSLQNVALLFPGQGAYYPGVLKQASRTFSSIVTVWSEIDAVAERRLGRRVSDAIWSDRSPSFEELAGEAPAMLQLAIFGTSVALFQILRDAGLRPRVLLGHSFGEIAALTCGGAFTVAEGAEIVCDRTEAARLVAADGYMAALGAGSVQAASLVGLLGNHDLVVAGENGATQTVLSGIRAKMDRAGEIAKVLNLGFHRLNSPYPFHSPLMEPVKQEFSRRLQRARPRPLDVPVFSPILGRYYQQGEAIADSLADHLVRPVKFGQAIGQLYEDGVRTVVECGALDALTKLAKRAAPAAELESVACLGDRDEVASLTRAFTALGLSVGARANDARLSAFLPDRLIDEEARDFWSSRGPDIKAFLEMEYERFRRDTRRTNDAPQVAHSIGSSARMEPHSGSSGAPGTNRDEVFRSLVAMYATALEYPEEVFTADVELEAELGIDSVKQTELLGRVSDHYNLPPRPAEFRLSNYNTLGKVADFIVAALRETPVPGAAAGSAHDAIQDRADVTPTGDRTRSYDELFERIVSLYAEALEYPEEVFTADVALEADLGIDSVKQTELLARLSDEFGLPPRPADFRLAHYDTLRKVADFVFAASGQESSAPPSLEAIQLVASSYSEVRSGEAFAIH